LFKAITTPLTQSSLKCLQIKNQVISRNTEPSKKKFVESTTSTLENTVEHSTGLSEAIGSFSRAVKFAIQVLPPESLSEYLAKVEKDNLQLLLNLFEQQEEYEICALILKTIKQNEDHSSL
jgi:hypothetical protein